MGCELAVSASQSTVAEGLNVDLRCVRYCGHDGSHYEHCNPGEAEEGSEEDGVALIHAAGKEHAVNPRDKRDDAGAHENSK